MDYSFGRVGRNSVQLQSRQATDTKDAGTYNIASLAFIKDYDNKPYQSSVGVALRQDFVDTHARTAQDRLDAEEAVTKAAAKVASPVNSTEDSSSTN